MLQKMNFSLKSKGYKGYINKYIYCIKQEKQCLYIPKEYSYSNDTSIKSSYPCSFLYNNKNKFNKRGPLSIQITKCLFNLSSFHRKFCTKSIIKPSNVFGDLSYEKYERVEMDEKELEEEIFTENDAKVPRWKKMSPGQYVDLIKSHLNNNDLNQALSVLDLVKKNQSKPNIYMFQLLIRAFAVQGNIKVCFNLYNKLKKYGFTSTDAIYNSLINVCAESKNTELALKYLHNLKVKFYQTNYVLNETHYITFIKAYSWHKQIKNAFQMADEAKTKGICTPGIYAALFHASISDKTCGLRYALILWHQMRNNNVKPNVIHYNLFLKAIKETAFGELHICDFLVPKIVGTQLKLNEIGESDLLNSPPILSTVFPKIRKNSLLQNKSTNIARHNNNNSEIVVTNKTVLSSQNLNDILAKNKLFLFGGAFKLLKRMESDKVTPNIKTLSLIMSLIPSSIQVEKQFLNYIYSRKLELDIEFFNMLIWKRNVRNKFKEAKDVLYDIQRNNLSPNILTFGVLALGCNQLEHGKNLLQQMKNINFEPNSIILGTLLQKACCHKDFEYISFLIEHMSRNEIKPSVYILKTLTNFERLITTFIKNKNMYTRKEVGKVRHDFNKFKMLLNECKIMETLK